MGNAMAAVLQAVENHKELILAAERHIWKNPEPGYREWKTHAYLKEKYEQLGYTLHEMGNIPGFYTEADTGRPGPCIGIFGEMDSLIIPTHPDCDPQTGAVHACGHHCQSAALLGIAAALKAPGALDGLCGKVRLIAVPAEEGIEIGWRKQLQKQGIIRYLTGKKEFMHRGVLDGVSMAFMLHTAAGNQLTCSKGGNGVVLKEAAFLGKTSHAGGSPHLGINALYAANCAMQAANALRETFLEGDYIRFHPIITEGGAAVNAIPDRVMVESYLRGASMEAIARENRKVNRAFAGAAAAMGCGLRLWDQHGFGVLVNHPGLKEVLRQTGVEVLGEERVSFTERWGTGSTDMGDVSCVMPAIHPHIGGAEGRGHTSAYRIVDPVCACVDSAKVQCAMAVRLLENEAALAKKVLAEGRQDYPTVKEYLAAVDELEMDRDVVTYREDGAVTLDL